MTLFNWQDSKHLLGVPQMDDTHKEFGDLVNQLVEISDSEDFKRVFLELLEHTRVHFDNEDRLMVDSAFPAIGEHRSEHDRVLGQLTQINTRVQNGMLVMGREYIKEMPNWFDVHAATMDSALAAHLKARG